MSLSEYGWEITDKKPNEQWNVGEYKILNANSGGGTFSRESSQASVAYICEYNHIERFLDTVLGKTVKVGAALLRSASNPNFDDANGSLPEEHPYWYNFFASSAEVEPAGVPSQTEFGPLWDKAKVTVVFRPPDYNVIADTFLVPSELRRFVTKTPEGQADFQTSLGFFKFVSDTNHRVLDITPGQTVPALRTTYTWRQVPVADRSDGFPELGKIPNLTTVLPLVGSVNSTDFDGYPPGTVLFVTWSARLVMPQVATDKNYYWDISYVLGIRDYGASSTPYVVGEHVGWNYAFDPLRDVWDLYTTDGTVSGKTMYKYTDLTQLFAVTW